MSWNFMEPSSRHNLVSAWEREASDFLDVASAPDAWEAPTAAGHWQVRDVVGHLVDTTESYFRAFDAVHGEAEPFEPLGVHDMAMHVDQGALALRDAPREELLDRLHQDLDRFRAVVDKVSDDEWAGQMVTHKFMGPLPAAFYPLFQLVDYGVHGWDMRTGLGATRGLDAQTADLLVPLAHILWQSTADVPADTEPYSIGIRVTSGENAGDTRIDVGADGLDVGAGDLDDVPTVIEFDPAGLVLTAYGRFDGGTVRGDRDVADRFMRLFFRI